LKVETTDLDVSFGWIDFAQVHLLRVLIHFKMLLPNLKAVFFLQPTANLWQLGKWWLLVNELLAMPTNEQREQQ
jgi:hypothetical protein